MVERLTSMIELLRSSDSVLVALLEVRLRERGIATVVLDEHVAAIYGGALGAVQRRIMVDEEKVESARWVLAQLIQEAGNG